MKFLAKWRELDWQMQIATVAAVFAIAAVLLSGSNWLVERVLQNRYVAPEAIRVDGGRIIVLSKKKVLWNHDFKVKEIIAEISDLDGDGTKEVIVGLKGEEKRAGTILAFDYKGDIVWEFQPTEITSNYRGGKSNRVTISDLLVTSLFDEKVKDIVVLYRDAHGWYQSCVALLNGKGKLSAKYWHPGHLTQVLVGSEERDGPKKIAVVGINNDLGGKFPGADYLRCVFLLDPNRIHGEAPPYLGKLKRGSQEWYGIILPKGIGFHRVDIVDHDDDGKNSICVWTSTGHVFYVDFQGRLIGRGRSDGTEGEAEFVLIDP